MIEWDKTDVHALGYGDGWFSAATFSDGDGFGLGDCGESRYGAGVGDEFVMELADLVAGAA